MGQNVRSLGGNLLHLCKVGLHRGQRVTVEIIKDAVVQILRAEVDLVVLAGVLAVQVMPSLSRSHSMPHRISTLPLYSALSFAMVALYWAVRLGLMQYSRSRCV